MLLRRLRYWLTRSQREADLRREMELHIEEKTAELIEIGIDEAEARTAARRRFGNVGLKGEESREIWIARWWSDFWQDVRYGARGIRRDPGFAVVAVTSAALGIGVCTTVFSFVNAAVLRPLPVEEPEQLQWITSTYGEREGVSLSFPELQDLRELTESWEGVAAIAFPLLDLGLRTERGGAPRQHWGFVVTANYFDVVRPRFALGGGFDPAKDDLPGAPAKIVLSHSTWLSRFDGDPSVVGQTVRVNTRPMTVVGVTGPDFQGTMLGVRTEFYLPFSQISELRGIFNGPGWMSSYEQRSLHVVGRMRPDVPLAQARAELDVVEEQIRERDPNPIEGRRFYLEREGLMDPTARRYLLPAFYLLLAITSLVLLTACANIANLMFARASARTREVATRLAIGSGRARLIRQLTTESFLLASMGALLGIGLASLAGRYVASLRLPFPVSVDLAIPIDGHVAAFSIALAVLTAVAFGLAPAMRATRLDLSKSLRAEGGNIAILRRFGLRNGLVVAQVAVSATLVICSGLFVRSLEFLRAIDTGMDVEDVALVRFDLSLGRYSDQQAEELMRNMTQTAGSLPGVEAVSVAAEMPLTFDGRSRSVYPRPDQREEERSRARTLTVGANYFQALGIPLIEGSDFDASNPSEDAVIISRRLADELFGNRGALDRFVYSEGHEFRVRAIVEDAKFAELQESAVPILYHRMLPANLTRREVRSPTLIVKAAGASGPSAETIVESLRSVDPELVVSSAGSMESHVLNALFMPRLAAALFGAAGLIGLLIASIGIYGVMSFAVARRTREIGVRIVLGARTSQVTAMVMRHGAGLALIGIFIGIAGGLAVAQAASSLIYGVSATDPLTFTVVPVILLSVAMIATAIPARRAARVDPNRTLRVD